MSMVSYLVQNVSGIREENEFQLEDNLDFNVYVSDAVMSSSYINEEVSTYLLNLQF